MNRQLIIGSLFGIALGGVLTSSIAHGVFGERTMTAATEAAGSEAAEAVLDTVQTLPAFDGAPPLRPGSARVGRPAAPTLAAEVPVALDAQAEPDSPTV